MKNTYSVKRHHSSDAQPESVIEPSVSFDEAKQMIDSVKNDWQAMGLDVKVLPRGTRAEAKGATFQMAIYMEKNK